MKDKTEAGTYDFGKFEENSKELERLIRQASIALDLERKLWPECGLKDGMNVIDLGCGPGITSTAMAEMVPNGNVTGVDISEELIAVANQQKDKKKVENLKFQTDNIYDLGVPENTYDFAYSRFLFQHLEHPLKALENVLRILKPGGIYCIADVDDAWLTVYPDLSDFNSFTQSAAIHQKNNGGDRFVGRKFTTYFYQVGFGNIKQFVVPITSHDIGMKNFLDITTGFKMEQIGPEQASESKKKLEKIYSLVDQPGAWGAVGVFVVMGVKS